MAAKRLGKKDRELTSREQSILDFIRQKVWEDGFPPTVREICQAVGLRSTSTVHGYLARLEELGVIKRDPASSRAIEVVNDASWRHKKMIPMPLVGAVRAGEPIVADEHLESIFPMPSELIGKDNNCFILVVRGDSMINAGIKEGDYLIVSEQETEISLLHSSAMTRQLSSVFTGKQIISGFSRKTMLINRLFPRMLSSEARLSVYTDTCKAFCFHN